jgi:hypothetical protein
VPKNLLSDFNAIGTVCGASVTQTWTPLARNRSTSSARFSSEFAMTRSGFSASTLSTSGYLEPPTRGTSKSDGCVQ